MSQGARVVTCYVLRKPHESISRGGKTIYQVWIVIEVLPVGEDALSEPETDPVLDADAAEKLSERLREAVAEVVAGRIEGVVWKTDDGSEEQVADFVAGLRDVVKTLVQTPLASLAAGVGVPAPIARFSAEVSATLVLKPVLEPVESALHALEVAVIALGSMTGLPHPLVITCVKHLAQDELGSALTSAINQIMKPSDAQALDDKQSTAGRSGKESFQMKSPHASAAVPLLPSNSPFGDVPTLTSREPHASTNEQDHNSGISSGASYGRARGGAVQMTAEEENQAATAREENRSGSARGDLSAM